MDVATLLRTHTGLSDVDDLLAVCAGLADEDCALYLSALPAAFPAVKSWQHRVPHV